MPATEDKATRKRVMIYIACVVVAVAAPIIIFVNEGRREISGEAYSTVGNVITACPGIRDTVVSVMTERGRITNTELKGIMKMSQDCQKNKLKKELTVSVRSGD